MRAIIVICAACCTLLLGAPQSSSQVREEKVDLGGFRLHTAIAGHGQPVVVFESGLGEDLQGSWTKVEPEISKLTETVKYDRAGIGQSDVSPNPRDAEHLADELYRMLKQAGVQGPYLLVGHSLGTLVVTVFAHQHPSEVAGIVLVDPAMPDSTLESQMPPEVWKKRKETLAQYMGKIPAPVQAELDNLEQSAKQAENAFPQPQVPAVMLTGTKINPEFPGAAEERDIKIKYHNQWAAKMPGVKRKTVSTSRHYIQDDDPQSVIAAIQQVLKQSRGGSSKAN